MNAPVRTGGEDSQAIAQTILDGFNKHYYLFRSYGHEAKVCFEHSDWSRAGEGRKERILGYEKRVTETVNALNKHFSSVFRINEFINNFTNMLLILTIIICFAFFFFLF